MNNAAARRIMIPMAPAAKPIPSAADGEMRDESRVGVGDSCAVDVGVCVYCEKDVDVLVL
jgi:hypothetical protein